MRRRSWARKVERYCCTAVTYFPLLFVYGLTSWAVWVEAGIGFAPSKSAWTGAFLPILFSIPSRLQHPRLSNQRLGHQNGKVITDTPTRKVLVSPRHLLLSYAQLELHYRRLHRSRLAP
jgi:hypothetical protein